MALPPPVPQPVAADPMKAALDAWQSGKDISQAVYGTTEIDKPVSGGDPWKADEKSTEVKIEGEYEANSSSEPQQESQSNDSDLSAKVEDSPSQAPKKVYEEIVVTDDSGRKKLRIDVTDPKKAAIEYAKRFYGNSKFKADKDKAEAKLKEIEPQFNNYKQAWDSLEDAYKNGGVKAVIGLISKDEKAYEMEVQREFDRKRAREEASPAEIRLMDLEEKIEQSEKARLKAELRVQENLSKSQVAQEEAELNNTQSVLNPSFEKYRFAGQLGDSAAEELYDSAVWNTTVKNLGQYPDDYKITPAIVDSEFRKVANTFRKVIASKADKSAQEVIKNKKLNAQESAGMKAINGFKSNTNADSFRKDIQGGNLMSAWQAVTSGKIKLS